MCPQLQNKTFGKLVKHITHSSDLNDLITNLLRYEIFGYGKSRRYDMFNSEYYHIHDMGELVGSIH